MELVWSISTEKGDDLIVSFEIIDPDDSENLENLSILRTPKYESLLDESERGPTVSFDRDDTDEPEYLHEVIYLPEENLVIVRTNEERYELDVHKVEPKDLASMARVLRAMNYDDRIQLTGC